MSDDLNPSKRALGAKCVRVAVSDFMWAIIQPYLSAIRKLDSSLSPSSLPLSWASNPEARIRVCWRSLFMAARSSKGAVVIDVFRELFCCTLKSGSLYMNSEPTRERSVGLSSSLNPFSPFIISTRAGLFRGAVSKPWRCHIWLLIRRRATCPRGLCDRLSLGFMTLMRERRLTSPLDTRRTEVGPAVVYWSPSSAPVVVTLAVCWQTNGRGLKVSRSLGNERKQATLTAEFRKWRLKKFRLIHKLMARGHVFESFLALFPD